MIDSARMIVAIPACAALAWAAVAALRLGSAETNAHEALREMNAWTVRHASPSGDEWLAVRRRLADALEVSPGDPAAREAMGVLHFQRAGTYAFTGYANEQFSQALVLRPTTPYAWASLAGTRYAMGLTDARFEQALVNAATLGPAEPEVQEAVADLGLAVWETLAPVSRQAVERAIAAGMRRDPDALLRISGQRGRLGPACRHVADAKRAHLCEVRGTT